MEKVTVFLDYANLDRASQTANCQVDYKGLLDYLANPEENRFLQAASAYVPINPRQEHARDAIIEQLWNDGFVVKSKVGTIAGDSYKCDYDVEITLDMTKAAFEIKPDIVVLVSGDSDFIPLVMELRNKGIRVEVASFGNSMSSKLKNRCSGFIDLDCLIQSDDVDDEYENQGEFKGRYDNQAEFEGKYDNQAEFEGAFEDEYGCENGCTDKDGVKNRNEDAADYNTNNEGIVNYKANNEAEAECSTNNEISENFDNTTNINNNPTSNESMDKKINIPSSQTQDYTGTNIDF